MSAITSKSVSASAVLHSLAIGGAIAMTLIWIGVPVVPRQERVIELFSGGRTGDVSDQASGSGGAAPRLSVFHYRPLPAYVPPREVPTANAEPLPGRSVVQSSHSKSENGKRISYAAFVAHNQVGTAARAPTGSVSGPIARVTVDSQALTGGGTGNSQDAVEAEHPGFISALAGVLHDAYLPDQVSASGLTVTIAIWIDGRGRIARTKLIEASGNAAFDSGVLKSALGLQVPDTPDDALNRWLTIHYQAR